MSLTTRALVVAAALALGAGCPPSTPKPTVTETPTLTFDGLVVFWTGAGFFLFDPSTGEAEPFQHPCGAPPAVSPDGRQLAYAWSGSSTEAPALIAAEPTLVDGKPALRELRRWTGPLGGNALAPLRFSADGQRLLVGTDLLDVATGARVGCESNGPTNVAIDLVDTGRFGCPYPPDDKVELRDVASGRVVARFGERFGERVGLGGVLNADSQWYGPVMHAPTATVRPRPPPALQPWTAETTYRFRQLRDGRYGFLSFGFNGRRAENKSSLGGTSAVVITTYDTTPLDGLESDPAERYAQRDWVESRSPWPVAAGLGPFLVDGEGREWQPLGLTEDGEGLLFLVKSWVLSISADTNIDPNNVEIEHAVVELRRDGERRGLRTSALFPVAEGVPPGTSSYRVVKQLGDLPPGADWSPTLDLGNREWLVEVDHGFVGFLGGEAVGLETHASGVFDGARGIVEVEDGATRRLCTFSLDAPLARRCMPLTVAGSVIGVMAHDVRGSAAKPALARLSRSAAWPGSTVTLAGHGFGDAPGELRLGGAPLPADHLISWSSSRVVFRVPASLPAKAAVELVTAAGASSAGRGRAAVLHRTALVTTPFTGATAAPQRVGQGLNRLEATGLPAGLTGVGGATLIGLDDGGYVAALPFAIDGDGGTRALLLDTGDEYRRLELDAEPRLADGARWQPVLERQPASTTAPIGYHWAWMGGALVDLFSQVTTRLDAQLTSCSVLQRNTNAPRAGLPEQWSLAPDGGTLAANGFGVGPLTGWRWASSTCQPEYGPLATPAPRLGVAASPATVLATGTATVGGQSGASVALSRDQGATFAAPLSATAALGRQGTSFSDPVWMGGLPTPAFIVAERAAGSTGGYRATLHAVHEDGGVTVDVASLPAAFEGSAPGATNRVLSAVDGTRLALLFTNARTLVVGDLGGAAPVALAVSPTAGDTGRVLSLWHDEASHELYVVRDDGAVLRATAAGGWADWAPLDLGIDLEVPTRVVPLAVARVPGSGRWVVTAALFDARASAAPDAGSPIARVATLLGPAP